MFWELNSITPKIKIHVYSFSMCLCIYMCHDMWRSGLLWVNTLLVLCGSLGSNLSFDESAFTCSSILLDQHFLKKLCFYIYLYLCLHLYLYEVRGQFGGISFSFHYVGLGIELKSVLTWWQVSISAEPSY